MLVWCRLHLSISLIYLILVSYLTWIIQFPAQRDRLRTLLQDGHAAHVQLPSLGHGAAGSYLSQQDGNAGNVATVPPPERAATEGMVYISLWIQLPPTVPVWYAKPIPGKIRGDCIYRLDFVLYISFKISSESERILKYIKTIIQWASKPNFLSESATRAPSWIKGVALGVGMRLKDKLREGGAEGNILLPVSSLASKQDLLG